ncbi:hypothetical protein [Rhizobium sp. BK251]|uniref:hypothetical protein n=1 Tax=Rhizobium sp. BK251 TaxID=2512125 RepID=UPI00104F713B|nr:hypothetical protein [Rhizobium sp. BK251]TCL70636.1 hypothetical protein EV286_107514 [Rhizobium sp. BK251]
MTDEEKEIAHVTGFIKVTSVGGPEETRWIRMSSVTTIVPSGEGYVIGGPSIVSFKCKENPLELIAEAAQV